MVKNTLDLYTSEEEITLKRYIKFLLTIIKEGGLKVKLALLAMQLFRILMFYFMLGYFTEFTSNDLWFYSTILTIGIYPLEVLSCWLLSVKVKQYIFGQLTGRP